MANAPLTRLHGLVEQGYVACSACAKRRARLQSLKEKQKARGQRIRAAMTGAVITASGVAGKAIGITGEDTHGLSGNEQAEDQGSPEAR